MSHIAEELAKQIAYYEYAIPGERSRKLDTKFVVLAFSGLFDKCLQNITQTYAEIRKLELYHSDPKACAALCERHRETIREYAAAARVIAKYLRYKPIDMYWLFKDEADRAVKLIETNYASALDYQIQTYRRQLVEASPEQRARLNTIIENLQKKLSLV